MHLGHSLKHSTLLLLISFQVCLLALRPALASRQECPNNWIAFGESCYRFVKSSSARFLDAAANCEGYGAKLLSVNKLEEHNFVLDWLRDHDFYRHQWLTSATVTPGLNNWQWSGDSSKFIDNNDLWLPVQPNQDRLAHTGAAYMFSQAANIWGLAGVDASLNYYERGLDFGARVRDLTPRGPKIEVEPKDIVFDISARSHLNRVQLKCVADAYPLPTYTWYKEDYSSDTVLATPINPLDDERLTQTDGTLTILNPNQQSDKGKYYCSVSNEFGRTISRTVSLTFGYILEFNKKRSVERGKENWGKSVSCDAPQHHSKVYYYWTKADFQDFVQEDRRVFISFDGNLYFSSLEKIDRSNYSCSIQSLISSTGRFGPSFPLVVEPASNGQKLQFANGFPKLFPENPLADDEIRLECMAYGYPTPYYNWSRISPTRQMPKKYHITNDGKVLIIQKARIEDEGEYVCRATSESELVHKSLRVSVQASPRFTIPLQDQVLGEREPLVWECEAFGLPQVTYSWLKNGEQLTQTGLSILDLGRYTIRDNKLTIDAVQKERDAGMYQCRASNQHGVVYSSAQLKVVNLAPSADKNPLPASISSMVDQNITIPCNVEAIPKPSISWRRDGLQLDDRFRLRVLPNGMLHISRLRISDQGSYECIAENNLGRLATKTWLQVRPAPVIVGPLPLGEIVNYGDPIKIVNCEVQSDYRTEIAHVWLKNGLPIDFTAGRKYYKTDSGQLVIRNVSYADQANYTCRAKTPAGYVEKSGSLLVRGPPDPCGSVLVDGLTHSSARVTWTDGADHMARIFFNSIEGRTNHNQTWQVLAANVSGQLVRNHLGSLSLSQFLRKTYYLNNVLLAWSIYEFRVTASNEYGTSEPSSASPKYRTEMAAPRLAPGNLRGGGGKAGTLFIRWDPLPVSEWAANELWYQVYYRLNGTYEWTKRELNLASGLTDAHTVNLGTDTYYRLFDVMVQAVNARGAGPLSQVAHIHSAQQMPRAQPNNVHGSAHNSTALNVTWAAWSAEEQDNGRLTGYRIRYWPTGKEPQTNSLTSLKRGLQPWGLAVGLQPDTEYQVAVSAYNEAGSGPESESFRLRTFKAAPQHAPTSVSAQFLDDTSLRVTWRGVSSVSTSEEPVLGYKLRYWRLDEPVGLARELLKRLGGDELALVIKDLLPGETYKLRVLAFSSGGDGKMSSPELIIKVKPQAP